MLQSYKILLPESEIPTHWYNIQADLPEPLPQMRHPQTKEPTELPPPLFCSAINEQEFSTERYVEIPEEVRDFYKSWRPSPLYRARRLEKFLDTPAKIFYKYEGGNATGSHKLNTAIAQAYYNKQAGVKRLTTETGAGQWGSALSIACNFFDLELKVYMVKVSFQQKPYRRILMESFNATCIPSPSPETAFGRAVLEKDPECSGSLGIAISEACEDAFSRDDTRYSLGSVLNHVLMHQTVMGMETRLQLEKVDTYPDIIIGCVGGGSNFAGLAFPFLKDKLSGEKPDLQFIAVEPEACPSVTRGKYAWDYGDVAGMAPIAKMYTLGHGFIPSSIHAGGLRYHGMAPLISQLTRMGHIVGRGEKQVPVFKSALEFARTEGILPAPEAAHAVKTAMDEAIRCKESGTAKTIVFSLSGHGYFDLTAYEKYLSNTLVDQPFPEEELKKTLSALPQINE